MQRMERGPDRGEKIAFYVNGKQMFAYAGESVAAVLLAAGIRQFRYSPRNNEPRAAFCFMGSCQECLVEIDGKRQLACQQRVTNGLSVKTADYNAP